MQEKRSIRTKDNLTLSLSCFRAATENGRVVIFGPAPGVRQHHYQTLAVYLQHYGYHALTFDYRCVGESRSPENGQKACLHQWAVQDADAVIRFARTEFPKREIIYIGHGVGGEIIGLAQASQYIDRLVLVNSALSCSRLFPLWVRIRVFFQGLFMNSTITFIRFFTRGYIAAISKLPKGTYSEWLSWYGNSNGLFDAFPDNNYMKLQIPLIAFSVDDDWRCPPRAVKALLQRFSNASIEWYHLRAAFLGRRRISHMGFFDPASQSTLWQVLTDWTLKERFDKEEAGKISLYKI